VYVTVWEYRLVTDVETFERVYGPDGDWARLFARGDGFLGTSLHRSVEGERRYLVLDRWESQAAAERFAERHAAEYDRLSRSCEPLWGEELRMGAFVAVG
jgi:heme-degrading monooxygenase HmoA